LFASSKPQQRETSNEQANTYRLRRERSEGRRRKGYWREVGAVWPHKNGKGFDLVLFDQLSVSGRIVCTERKDKPETTEVEAQ
jgi:hypothetical protein